MRCISQVACIIALVGCSQPPASSDVANGSGNPGAGRLKYPQSVNPGDPENAVKDFKRIYWALDEYRKKYNKLPLPSKLQDTSKELLPGVKLEPEDFENPDVQYSEFDPGQQPQPAYSFSYYPVPKPPPGSPRLKGVPDDNWHKPIFPKKNERYIWADTYIYRRSGARIHQSGLTTYHYHGQYVFLWSDGVIEVVPESKMIVDPISDTSWRLLTPSSHRRSSKSYPVTKQWAEQNAEAKQPYITWDE